MNKKEKLAKEKNSNGITLIALVITIIVLIILAGVSISLILGENGIIAKARLAKSKSEEASLNEGTILNQLPDYIENLGEVIVKGPTSGGTYDNPYIPAGFIHKEGEGTWNSGYVIREEATGNEFVWVPCVLTQTEESTKAGVVTFGKTLPETTESTDLYYMYNKINLTITGDESPASDIRTSVGTYGGFYIARYEAGIEGTTDNDGLASDKRMATDGTVKPLSKAGCGVWNYISRTNALTVAASMVSTTDGVKSGLISGECWDTTLQWMVNASDNKEKNAGYDTNSDGKGWYYNVSNSKINTTGYYPVNNIYDMAGNVLEWTTENCTFYGNSCLVGRGGVYNSFGSVFPAAYRNSSFDYTGSDMGFRVVLYK